MKQKIRRSVLAAICRAWFSGNKSALASALGTSVGYVNNVLAGRRSFGEKAASSICSHLEIPRGSLDTPLDGPLGPRESRPFEVRKMMGERTIKYARYLELMPDGPMKRQLEQMIEAAFEEFGKTPTHDRQKPPREKLQ